MSGAMPDEALCGLSTTGADDFLAKPFKPGEFVSRVRALMLRRSPAPGQTLSGNPTLRIAATATVRELALRPSAPLRGPGRGSVADDLPTVGGDRTWRPRGTGADRPLCPRAGRRGHRSGRILPIEGRCLSRSPGGYRADHDVGLLAVPRGILMKPDKLDAEELAAVQTHVSVGSEILMTVAGKLAAELPSLPLAAEVARSHHERWDGTGYPDQLTGTEIPLAARVIGLVEVYEALRVRRPHRPPIAHPRAVKIIANESPGQFDPILVAAFVAAAPRFEQIHIGG